MASLGVPTLEVGNRQHGRERAMSVIHCDATRGAVMMSLSVITTPMIKGISAKKSNPYFQADTPGVMVGAIKDFLKR